MTRSCRWWVALPMVIAVAVVAIGLHLSLAEADDGAPEMPHGISGQEQCLACHSFEDIAPAPPSHITFDENSCLSCHSSSAAAAGEMDCLSCHGQLGVWMALDNGERLLLYVDREVIAASVHGDKLLCTDCHSTSTYHRPERSIASAREYSVTRYELCKRCHFDNYTKTLDSIHYEMLAAGDLKAPLCTDCHGAHNVTVPYQPPAKISRTCSMCHETLYEKYVASTHGRALIEEDNYDVPVCTDCHSSHNIHDPRTASFRLESVELCGSCHGDEKLMGKYGISTKVLKSYLEDFHGQTVSLIGKESKDIWAEAAVCTDCHGIHDIISAEDPNSPVMKANLVATCQKCHPDATANFPSAWLSHYEPSLDKAPVVLLVTWSYRILIPFIMLGLSIHVLVDLWRAITNR